MYVTPVCNRFLQVWEDIQILMGKLGRDSLIRRVKQFDTVNVAPDQKFTVDRILTKHDETAARIASAGCGTFYVWVCLQGKIPTYFIIIIIQKRLFSFIASETLLMHS